jgi:hypothetical protein
VNNLRGVFHGVNRPLLDFLASILIFLV